MQPGNQIQSSSASSQRKRAFSLSSLSFSYPFLPIPLRPLKGKGVFLPFEIDAFSAV